MKLISTTWRSLVVIVTLRITKYQRAYKIMNDSKKQYTDEYKIEVANDTHPFF